MDWLGDAMMCVKLGHRCPTCGRFTRFSMMYLMYWWKGFLLQHHFCIGSRCALMKRSVPHHSSHNTHLERHHRIELISSDDSFSNLSRLHFLWPSKRWYKKLMRGDDLPFIFKVFSESKSFSCEEPSNLHQMS